MSASDSQASPQFKYQRYETDGEAPPGSGGHLPDLEQGVHSLHSPTWNENSAFFTNIDLPQNNVDFNELGINNLDKFFVNCYQYFEGIY
jgi:hypothetical protein